MDRNVILAPAFAPTFLSVVSPVTNEVLVAVTLSRVYLLAGISLLCEGGCSDGAVA